MPQPLVRPRPLVQQIEEAAEAPPQQVDPQDEGKADWRRTISTGSTLLDKAISGGKCRYGGMPGGFIMEGSGPSSSGKTTLLGELWGNTQRAGGECRFDDPENRLDASYCETFGIHVNQDAIEHSHTVTDVFDFLIGPVEGKSAGSKTVNKRAHDKAWSPDPSSINFLGVDSLAALASRMEVESGDKMGQKRAKDFSEGFRVAKAHVSNHNIIMACSNQLRIDMDTGRAKTPGGEAIGFYCSVRISLFVTEILKREIQLGAGRKKILPYGMKVLATVIKNSLGVPLRQAPLRLIYNYGLDDIGANLQWLKDHGAFDAPDSKTGKMKEASSYHVGSKKYVGLELAIKAVEEQNLEQVVRDQVCDLWDVVEAQVAPVRKEKVR